MNEKSRVIRVFLSSTFRDFGEERDLLVKKVFPELRRLCRQRQVELVEVDLRWGITAEEAEQGKVLPICLGEIDRARPYFMGFIGDRYGWVPEGSQYPAGIVEREPWLEEHQGGKSVTELEMLHGVLNNPEMAGRAFFYYRDTEYSKAKGGDYAAESPEHAAKLENLKERIRASKFPVEEDYPDPEALAELVRRDLQALIEEEYPEEEVPDALTLERMRHEAYGAARRRLYLGGEEYFEILNKAVARDGDESRPVLVTAEAGLGKSALLSNWLERWREDHPKALVFLHHFSASSDAADPVRLIRRLMAEVSGVTGEALKPEDNPEKVLEQLPTVLATMSSYAVREKREWLVVLDGLDKVSGHEHLRWFPLMIPEGLKSVVSCTMGPIEEALRDQLNWERVELEPFSEARCREFIGTYLSDFRKTLPEELVARILGHPLSNRPLWLLTLLEELRLFGVHEELEARLMTVLSDPPGKEAGEAPTIDDLYEHVLARIEVDIEGDYEVEAFKAIWASRNGLACNELLELTGMPPAKWAEIQTALDENLFESGGQITFGNQFIRKAVEDMHLPGDEDKRSAHRWLGEWFDQLACLDGVDQRTAAELPWQYQQAGMNKELIDTLTDEAVFESLYDRDSYELIGYWLDLEENPVPHYERSWSQWRDNSDDETELFESGFILAEFLRKLGATSPFIAAIYQQSLKTVKKISDAPDRLAVENSMGLHLMNQGNYTEAEKIFRQGIGELESLVGRHHPDTLDGINNLARCLRLLGQFTEAEKLYAEALDQRTKLFGHYHEGTISSLIGSGTVAAAIGDYDGALKFNERALKAQNRLYGEDSEVALGTTQNIGNLLHTKGDLEGAEDLIRKANQGFTSLLGENHPTTLSSVSSLARLLRAKGDLEGAEALYRRLLEGREQALGPEHPDTLASVGNFGALLWSKGDLDGAETLYRRALDGKEQAFGPEHPETLSSVNGLASVLATKGDLDGAEKLFLRALKGLEETLGPKHPAVLDIVKKLGQLFINKGNLDDAEKLLRQALEGYDETLGSDHLETLTRVRCLGDLLLSKNDYEGAEKLYQQALEGGEKTNRHDHPNTLICINNLGVILNKSGDLEGALKLLRSYASHSAKAEDTLAYNLACYECLEGNTDEAKRLIAAHLKKHPEKKENALKDEDFAAIRDWIGKL